MFYRELKTGERISKEEGIKEEKSKEKGKRERRRHK